MFRTPRLLTALLGMKWLSEKPAHLTLQLLTWNANLAAEPVVQEGLVGNSAMRPAGARHTATVDAQCDP